MSSSIQIVVTCSDRKSAPVPHRLRLRSIRADRSISTRAALWIERLENEEAPTKKAEQLYAGEHWTSVLDLGRTASSQGFVADLRVCSAGYGLIRAGASLKPYAATFSRGHVDSIDHSTTSSSPEAQWWEEIAEWEGPEPGEARSLRELAEARPRTPLILIAGATYLRAITEDALAAGEVLGPRLFVVSTGSGSSSRLDSFLVPADARLQHRLGGSRMGLNARVAGLVLELSHGELERTALLKKLKRISSRMPEPPTYDRRSRSDEQVTSWIEKALSSEPALSASAALESYRAEGLACEQSRFSRLFRISRGEHLGD